MNSLETLKYHFKTFHFTGALPPPEQTVFHKIWSWIFFLIVGVLFPFSQILSIFFAKSINEMVDRLIITSSAVVVVAKGLNLYTKCQQLMDFFAILRLLDREITETRHINQFNKVIRDAHRLYYLFLYPFIATCVLLVFQTIYSRPEIRLWSSTFTYPFEWAQDVCIYVGGLFFQGIANTSMVIFAVSVDTYGVILIHVVTSHIKVLNESLEQLGAKYSHFQSKQAINELIYYCKVYENILSCSSQMEYVLGLALFAQYGVSGIVLCTSAYQLTIISPHDVSKFSFVILYFMCMLTEIFIPCYFGSNILEESSSTIHSIYKSNWIGQTEKYKRLLRIFFERTLRPIHLQTGVLFMLYLSQFLRILRTAYSLFALLKNVE